jgi:hypothetical protein
MRRKEWRRLVVVVVALAWLMQPAWSASQNASAGVPDPRDIEPKSGPPGTVSVVDGDPCNDDETAFVWFREGDSVGGEPDPAPPYVASAELRLSTGGQISFVVPDLPAGSYELSASCKESGPDIPSVAFAVFTVVPDTATATPPVREPPGGALLPVVAAIVGVLSWQLRMRRSDAPSGDEEDPTAL